MALHRKMKSDARKIRPQRRSACNRSFYRPPLLRAFAPTCSDDDAEAANAAGLTRQCAAAADDFAGTGLCPFRRQAIHADAARAGAGFAWLRATPVRVGEPIAKQLAEQLNETVSIGTLDIPDVVYVVRALSSRALHLRVGPGTRIPAHTSSMGIILLGTLEPSQLAAFFKQWPRRRYTDRTPVEESEVRDLVQAAGRDGFCYLRGVMEDSIAGLSVPVRDRVKGRAIAALNVSTSLQRTSPEEALAKLLPELRAAAASIEAALR